LLREVEASLPDPSVDEIERELGELDLLHYCQPALMRRKSSSITPED
jgi:hypothetical protein